MEQHRERLVLCAQRVLGDRHEAEDVAQEVLIKAPGDATVGWLYAAAYRGAIDRVRARERRKQSLDSLRALGPTVVARESAFDLEAVRLRLDGLDEPYRSAVSLRYLDELDFKEVAKRLGTLERTARTWVARGLQKLRDGLEVER